MEILSLNSTILNGLLAKVLISYCTVTFWRVIQRTDLKMLSKHEYRQTSIEQIQIRISKSGFCEKDKYDSPCHECPLWTWQIYFQFFICKFSGSLEEILSEYTMEIFVKQIDRATEEPHHKRPRRGSSES